jgi:hypothetical protein
LKHNSPAHFGTGLLCFYKTGTRSGFAALDFLSLEVGQQDDGITNLFWTDLQRIQAETMRFAFLPTSSKMTIFDRKGGRVGLAANRHMFFAKSVLPSHLAKAVQTGEKYLDAHILLLYD